MTNQRHLRFSEDVSKPAPDISATGMIISTLPVLFVFCLSLYLRLGNVQVLLIAAIRCVAQLMILGLILYPIFVNNQPYVVIPCIFIMLAFATREAFVKPKYQYRGMKWHMLLSLTLGLSTSFTIITGGVLRPDPWWDASVMIPVCGMIMGSSVTALSLGMERLLMSLSDSGGRGSARLQTYLACGATIWEASLPSVREAIETGLTPNLNQMSMMGLVSIPGMMAGQILGGTSPLIAAKYQMVIMFFICSNSIMVLFGTIVLAIFQRLFDSQHRFQSEVVTKRSGGKPVDIVLAFVYLIMRLFGFSTKDAVSDSDIGENNRSNAHHMSVRKSSMVRFSIKHTKHTSYSLDPTIGSSMKRGTFKVSSSAIGSSLELLRLQKGEIKYDNTLNLSSLEVIIREGDILLLKGPSGCGKTTLLRGLALFETFGKDAKIELGGKLLNELNGATFWRVEVCYVRQQGGQGLRGTPLGLLHELCQLHSQKHRISKEMSKTKQKQNFSSKIVTQVVERAQRNVEALSLPPDMLSRQWDELSGGESQRLYLCVLLALQPKICLLDEPTSALDEQNSLLVEKLLLDSGISLVWVTHNLDQMERLQENSRTTVLEYQET